MINACRNQAGLLRVVDNPTDCLRNETLVSWNVQGLKGEPSVAGAPGPTGPQGPPGEVSTIDDFTGDVCSAYGRTGEVYVRHSEYTIMTMCFVEDDGDAAGGNDTAETATQVMPPAGIPFVNVGPSTTYPVEDVDWYVIPAAAFPGTKSIAFQGFNTTLHVQIYRDGASAADLVKDGAGNAPNPFYLHTADGQTWYERITRNDPAEPALYVFYVG